MVRAVGGKAKTAEKYLSFIGLYIIDRELQ